MKYYKVRPEYDNVNLYTRKRKIHHGILIANELYTISEWEKLEKNCKTMRKLKPIEEAVTLVRIPKTKTYWFFGARFAD